MITASRSVHVPDWQTNCHIIYVMYLITGIYMYLLYPASRKF